MNDLIRIVVLTFHASTPSFCCCYADTACVIPKPDALRGCEGVLHQVVSFMSPFPWEYGIMRKCFLSMGSLGIISMHFVTLPMPWSFSVAPQFLMVSLFALHVKVYVLWILVLWMLVSCYSWKKTALPSFQGYITFVTNKWLLVVCLQFWNCHHKFVLL